MPEIAVGTKVFTRTDKLENLIKSVPEYVNQIYIADDGKENEERDAIYREYDVNVIDLEYDAGVGIGRNAIIDECTEEYMCIVDSDHRLPGNLDALVEQLKEDSSLGGVGGALFEPENNQIRYVGQDFEEKNNGRILVRSPVLEQKDIELVAGQPLVRFDFLPTAAVFRTEMLNDYPRDENYIIGGEHGDFYINLWKNSDWEFGINPSVIFQHYPGGSEDYLSERMDDEKLSESQKYLMDKWGYDKEVPGGYHWAKITEYGGGERSLPKKIARTMEEDGPMGLLSQTPRYIRRKLHEINNK